MGALAMPRTYDDSNACPIDSETLTAALAFRARVGLDWKGTLAQAWARHDLDGLGPVLLAARDAYGPRLLDSPSLALTEAHLLGQCARMLAWANGEANAYRYVDGIDLVRFLSAMAERARREGR